MARILKNKDLLHTKLAAGYGGWMYCAACGENIGYLCYQTYDSLELKYKCNCGSEGSVDIHFDDSKEGTECSNDLVTVKNRLCCSFDNQPLITLLDKKLSEYDMKITCKSCHTIYRKTKKA